MNKVIENDEKKVLEKASSLVALLLKFKFLKIFRYIFIYIDKILMLFIRKPNKNMQQKDNTKKQVLLFPNLGVGDAIQFLSVTDKYRKAYPKEEYEITFMCRKSVIDIFKNETDFDYFKIINIDEGMFNLKKRYKILKETNDKIYDILIDAITPLSCSMNLYVSKANYAKEKITLVNDKTTIVPKKILEKTYTKMYHISEENYPTIKMYNKLIDGILGNFENEVINFHKTKQYDINKNLPKEYYMVFPSSKLDKKKWNIEKYAEIIKRIYNKTKLELVMCGTNEDEETYGKLKKLINVPYRIEKQIPIMEYIQLIKNAKFVISNDSGAYHIAVSENIPVTVITGKYAFDRYIIYDFKSDYKYKKPYIVKSDINKCKNCGDDCPYYTADRNIYPCLEEITIEDVWNKINTMIEEVSM